MMKNTERFLSKINALLIAMFVLATTAHVNAASFPRAGLYGMGTCTYAQLGIGLVVDQNTPQLLDPSKWGGPVASGQNHTIILDNAGTVWFTGDDGSNQFGDGTVNSTTATLIQSRFDSVKMVAAGNFHSLMLMDDGRVYAAGEGSSGQLGNGGVDVDTFGLILPGGGAKVYAYGHNSYIIKEDGSLWGFGANFYGELGTGATGHSVNRPMQVLANGVVAVAPGLTHTLVLMDDGSVYGMGLNTYGQFGDGTTDASALPVLCVASDVKQVAAGNEFSLFLMTDGSLLGVGNNSYGQLSTGDNLPQPSPVTVEASNVVDMAAGNGHIVYVKEDGSLWGCGKNGNGQLGAGDFSPRYSKVQIVSSGVAEVFTSYNTTFFNTKTITGLSINGLDSVFAGGPVNYSCAARWSDGKTTDVTEAVVWSTDTTDGAFIQNKGILEVATDADDTIRIAAGYFGMTATRDVYIKDLPAGSPVIGMGNNAWSQLGQDNTGYQPVPVSIDSGSIISAAGGRQHSLYVREDGSVWGMGNNDNGQLGTGDRYPESVPYHILSRGALKVACGEYHSLIVMRDGSLWSMGRNGNGQLGDGTRIDRDTPVCIERTGVIDACAGEHHSVFLKSNGDVYTMGRNIEGQLCTGDTLGRTVPYHVTAPGNVTRIAAGMDHTLLLDGNDDLYGAGSNSSGQLGLLSLVLQQNSPVPLAMAVRSIAAGGRHSAYVSNDRLLYVSGDNTYGQLGIGSWGDQRYGFELLSGYTDLKTVAMGANFTVFVVGDSMYATGDNNDGQFGTGTFNVTLTPVLLPHTDITAIACGNDHMLMIQREITGIRVAGPSSVETGDTAVYTCTAVWTDDTETDESDSAAWAVTAGGHFVNNALIADSTVADSSAAVTVTYGTWADTLAVTIIPAVVGIRITGPDTVIEDSSGIYACIADLMGGATREVSIAAAWSVDSAYATVSAGTLYTDTVAADRPVRITAVYREDTVNVDVVVQHVPVSSITTVDVPASGGFSIFPNPAARTADGVKFSIPVTLPGQWNIKAYDALGNLVAEAELDAVGETTCHLKLRDTTGGRYVIVGMRRDDAGTVEVFRRTVGVQ